MTVKLGFKLLGLQLAALLAVCVACKAPDIDKMIQGVDKATAAARVVTGDLDDGVTQGLLTAETAAKVKPITLRLVANLETTGAALHKIKEMTPQDRKNILLLLEPIADGLTQADLSDIKDSKLRTKLELSFLGVRTGLETIRIVLRE